MIKTQPQEAIIHVDPFSFIADIQVIYGNPVQNYNKDTDSYEPDRSLVPCLLMPYVNVVDPEGVMDGLQKITGVEWYEGAPAADGSNRIVTGPDYIIGDVDTPAYSLKVKKNIEPDSPIEIHAIFTFTDKNRNQAVSIERSIILRTSLFDSQNFSVGIDVPKGWTVNPLEVTPDENGRWMQTINAQLYSGKEPVSDSNAAYWWQILEGGQWRDFSDDEKNLFVSGDTTRSLVVDMRFVTNMTVRVRASYYTGSRPSAPTNDELQKSTTVNVQFPPTFRAVVRQTMGFKASPGMTGKVGYEVVLSDNNNEIGSDKDFLFSIKWYARSSKAGSVEKQIGSGRSISLTPSELGMDPLYPVSVYASVAMYRCHAIVVKDNRMLVKDGKAVIARKYQ